MPCVRMQSDSNSGSTRQMWSASQADASVLRWTRLHRIFIRVHLWIMSPVACALSVWSRWRPPAVWPGKCSARHSGGAELSLTLLTESFFSFTVETLIRCCATPLMDAWLMMSAIEMCSLLWLNTRVGDVTEPTLRRKLDGGTDKEDVELLFLASSLENKVMFTFWDGEKSFF